MFNLTVSEAHTFYVGTQGWLVHNGNTADPWGLEPGHGLKGDSSTKNVIKIAKELKANGWANVPSVKVIEVDGQLAVIDGDHRLAAARKVGIDVSYDIVDEKWMRENTGWKTLDELRNDLTMPRSFKLNPYLLKKAGLC